MRNLRTAGPAGSGGRPSSPIDKRSERDKEGGVNFGDILDRWEKQYPVNADYARDVSRDSAPAGKKNLILEHRSRLRRKKPDDSIDLHGLNKEDAWITLENFFENSHRRGFRKVLIIHGKGNHRSSGANCPGEGILRDISRRFIEHCSFAGESGSGTAREGGSGATWVILKN